MSNGLCKEKDKNKYARHTRDPRFVCKKCDRVARKKKWLCKPIRIDS
jgi:hypothetical protein